MPLVIDASAIVPLALSDEDAAYSNRVLERVDRDGFCVAPPIFLDELYNVLLQAERRGRVDPELAERFLARVVSALPLIDDTAPDRALSMRLARKTGLSFYDATYLQMAVESQGTIATHDARLASAARSENVPVFG